MGTGSVQQVGPATQIERVAAAVVVYRPDEVHLRHLVEVVVHEVERLFVFCNEPISDALVKVFEADPRLHLLDSAVNVGVGAALNISGLAAAWLGFDAIVYFDQDSKPAPGTIVALKAAAASLAQLGHAPAVVAPTLVVDPAAVSKAPRYRYRTPVAGPQPRAVEFVPTSGSLVPIQALRRTGFFRSDYFIDGIDLEWCHRATSVGLTCWVLANVQMHHSVGSGVIALPFARFSMPKQTPLRMYYLVRNTIYGARLAHLPWRWRLLQLAYLGVQMPIYVLFHRCRPHIIALLLTGIFHGILGRLGPAGQART